MGKAAKRRKAHRRGYLAEVSYQEPERFEYEWSIRIASWLTEIRNRTQDWRAEGVSSDKRVFEILDEAMRILQGCERSIYQKFWPQTYELICNECCSRVAGVVDRRLYRLSNMDKLALRSKAGRRAG